jgi:hypothetical protein
MRKDLLNGAVSPMADEAAMGDQSRIVVNPVPGQHVAIDRKPRLCVGVLGMPPHERYPAVVAVGHHMLDDGLHPRTVVDLDTGCPPYPSVTKLM